MNTSEKNQVESKDPPIGFVKEVAKYFMNFLETDFKKRRIPKRNTIQKTNKGLKVGMDLEKYPKLKKTFLDILNNGFRKEELHIKKKEYTTNIPNSLIELLVSRIKKLSSKNLENVFKKIEQLAEENAILYKKQYDKFLEETKEKTKDIFSKDFILPFLDDLDKPLENLDIADENSKYQLEIDITDSIFSIFEEKYTEILRNFFQKPKDPKFQNSLGEIIVLPEIQDKLVKFFENFTIGDAFYDIYQIFRNNKLVDKTEIYIYFYEISLGNEKFPFLYLPVTLVKEEDEFTIQFEKRLFVNTKAIDFVVQEFNLETKNKATLAGEFDRIIYFSDEDDFYPKLENYIRKIENFFELNRNIVLQDAQHQKGVNLVSSFSNKCYLYLFDKSDEALINDYEEILNDNGDILDNFTNLLNDFIEKNPEAYMEEVEDEWEAESIPKKLLVESPIPLNEEQKQVLIALQKPDCKFIILEGPPGTGKSHTITAIICKALLEEQSVLVLSDKKEALDVVEDKISSTLNKVRHEDDFQNPILRLGKTGNKFYKIVQGQTVSSIKEHYRAYKNNKSEYDVARKQALANLEENIKNNIDYFENINIGDIELYFQNVDNFSKFHWIDNENVVSLKDDFLKIKNVIGKLKKVDNCNFKADFVTENNCELIHKLNNAFRELNELKDSFNNIVTYEKELKHLDNFYNEERGEISQTLKTIRENFIDINKLSSSIFFEDFKKITDNISFAEIKKKQIVYAKIIEIYKKSKKIFSKHLNNAELIENFVVSKEVEVSTAINKLGKYLKEIKGLRNPLLGYLFKKDKIHDLTRKLKKTFHFLNLNEPEKNIKLLFEIYDLFEFISSKITKNNENEFNGILKLLIQNNNHEKIEIHKQFEKELNNIVNEIDKIKDFEDLKISDIENYIEFIRLLGLVDIIQSLHEEIQNIGLSINTDSHHLKFKPLTKAIKYLSNLENSLSEVLKVKDDIQFLKDFQENNPKVAGNILLHINYDNIDKLDCTLMKVPDKTILKYFKYKEIEFKLENQFNKQPEDTFSNSITEIEDLVAAQMTYFLDKRIIEYTENCAGEVNTLKNIIRKKQKFPKSLFSNLKKAFPCILAGIRDYAEFIPLEKDLFDIIIIDEASQVSVAQALPALVRGKKIIVLGDDKQFSNVKANNASTVSNQQYKRKIESVFTEERIKKDDKYGWLQKVKQNFDIKNSILKFLRFIRNYECQLKKHFRCYPEIISYSDKYFYQNTLQCMKIRGKPIEEVIKIDTIKHDGKFDETKNTNELEANHIIKKLKEFKEKGLEQSLGIISPHREQVTMLYDKINELPERDWLFGKCKLKIMTFDTCQGEERDYIFYSMVATREKDRLNWIFLKDFSTISDEVEGTIKAQRMNVGFSRAKECIHFVLSKPIEEFQGEIKNAMLHYKNELETSGKRVSGGTDKNSPMEDEIHHYFYETKFYKDNKDNKTIELIPQFPIGDYLSQLDKNYKHPAYKVDFLLIYEGQKIIIEYDGFKEHFVDLDEVNQSTYKYYMKANDVYRQKVLEGYGYKFLRINKFNIGDDPIQTLNDRLENLVKKKPKNR